MDFSGCYLNIRKSERENHVFRIMSLSRLFELFEGRKNTLVKPHKWDDPFENFILGMKAELPTGERIEFGQRHSFYGQCWTLTASSDAMWRIYSGDKRSVRIRSRIRKLVETFDRTAVGMVFAGKVQYLSTDEMVTWARRLFRRAAVPDVHVIAKTLLVKRKAFSHEDEVRLLYFEGQPGGELYAYRVDANSLIEDIAVDPRLTDEEAAQIIQEVRTRTGFRGRITQSNLYAPPSEMVLRLGSAYSLLPRSSAKVSYAAGMRTVRSSGDRSQLLLPGQSRPFWSGKGASRDESSGVRKRTRTRTTGIE